MSSFNVVDMIVAKREGRALEASEIQSLIAAYTASEVPDYQMSAFLMAAFLRGMSRSETLALTDAMRCSGITLDLSSVPGTKVDKHSTGGVGDKISLILAPIVASCGVPVPMVAGRGLGFTGGTLDKLESIPGFRSSLSISQFREQLRAIGLVIMGQTDEIAPADGLLYALRDVTGTVEYVPFIASSIMSKKLAAGIDALVLDVKCGSGAFMKDESDARLLAETLVEIGRRAGVRTTAWLSDMHTPLGRAVGNWAEVLESIRCLQGENVPDVMELVRALAGEMLVLGGKAGDPEEGVRMAEDAVASGRAFDKFVEFVRAQHGDERILRNPELVELEPATEVRSSREGYVTRVDALVIGRTATVMGAGRLRKEDPVDPLAGIELHKTPGDRVKTGDVLAVLYTSRTAQLSAASEAVSRAFDIRPERDERRASVLIDRLDDEGWGGGP